MKTCPLCKIEKDLDLFSFRSEKMLRIVGVLSVIENIKG